MKNPISLTTVLNEQALISFLQKPTNFFLKDKLIKSGRLILFRKVHYSIQISILSSKQNNKENFEIPIPFDVEYYPDENLVYFDYRVASLKSKNLPTIYKKPSSNFYNKILEISLQN